MGSWLLLSLLLMALPGCGGAASNAEKKGEMTQVTESTRISDVIGDPLFEDFGRLLFPVDSGYWGGDTLGSLSLTWYGHIRPARTVGIVNALREQASAGNRVFYRIYSEEDMRADPRKADTGLFFFRGRPGARFAVCSAGGGFVYVGAMHDSFPHAQELSKKGYNAFALIYRPGAGTACEDLARAIAFIHEHAEELGVDVSDYSLWGGSAGARMAAWLGARGTGAFGEKSCPRPAAVVMQYTGLSEVTGEEPPTYTAWGRRTGSPPTARCRRGRAGYGPRERMRRSRCSKAFPTALDWARGPSRRVGSIAPWLSGNGRCDSPATSPIRLGSSLVPLRAR